MTGLRNGFCDEVGAAALTMFDMQRVAARCSKKRGVAHGEEESDAR